MRSFFSAIWLLLSLKCEHSSQFISEGLDGDLTKVEQWAVRLHYLTCTSCRRFRNSMEFLRTAASQMATTSEDELVTLGSEFQLSPKARLRIEQAMGSDQA